MTPIHSPAQALRPHSAGDFNLVKAVSSSLIVAGYGYGLGYVGGKLCNVNASLAAKVTAVWCLASFLPTLAKVCRRERGRQILMEFSQIRPYLSDIAKYAVSAAISAGLSAGLGYAYGKVFKADASLAAKVWAASSLAQKIIESTTEALFGDGGGSRSRIISTLTGVIDRTATILALRHFNLIATNGTIFLSMEAVLLAALRVRNAVIAHNRSRE